MAKFFRQRAVAKSRLYDGASAFWFEVVEMRQIIMAIDMQIFLV